MGETRIDPTLGTVVHIVGDHQDRPDLTTTACPLCVGGREAPEPYDVKWFADTSPAMEDERCEVVAYTSDHDATFWSLGHDGIRRVIDLWAQRTAALGGRDDVDYVLVFENRDAEVGTASAHPHGRIYAFDHVPGRPRRRLEAGWRPDPNPGDRLVASRDEWVAWVPYAPTFPVSIEIAPSRRIADLPSLSRDERDGLAEMLVDILGRLDRLYDRPLPYMMWLNQRPTVGSGFVDAWFNIEIVSHWKSAGAAHPIGAAEVASEEYFNPVHPSDLADRLRDVV